ncbi:MAG: helix-turn-helix domain-containing protein [Hyphomicrobiales bacterium]|nr:helix-turn-helix domain-containing protein [Hyphomicrobiales bacterium]
MSAHRDMTIGEASAATGVNIETIRYYERAGLIAPPVRSGGGRRLYGHEQASQLRFIRNCRSLGFKMEDIRALMSLPQNGGGAAEAEARALTARHLSEVRAKIAELKKLEAALKTMVSACKPGEQSTCPIVAALAAPGSNAAQ